MKSIIQKWYSKLGFPKEYDEEFYRILENSTLDADTAKKSWEEIADPVQILLAYLYRCEALSEKYTELGIGEDILLDTLSDIVIWTNNHYAIHGKLGVTAESWLDGHLRGNIYRLGRLQFGPSKAELDIPELGVKQGDNIMTVHIPQGESMDIDACRESLSRANKFFRKYFPEYEWCCFTCHSWLLDDTLLSFVRDDSNIAKFARLFTVFSREISDAALKYVFRFEATRESLDSFDAKTSLAKKIKEHISAGGVLYSALGYIPRQNY